MFEEQVFEDRDMDLDEEDDIKIMDTRQYHWWDVSEYNDEYRSKIHSLMCGVYIKDKEQLIKRELLVAVPNPKGGGIIWTSVKYNIIDEKEE